MVNIDENLLLKSQILSQRYQTIMSDTLPYLFQGLNFARENSGHPNADVLYHKANHLLQGSMVVYLFAIWEDVIGWDVVQTYFDDNEKVRFYALKHIRLVSAHNDEGSRLSNRSDSEYLDHFEKFDKVMTSESPFYEVDFDEGRVDLSRSQISLDCRDFLQKMAMQLLIRIGAKLGEGSVRAATPLV